MKAAILVNLKEELVVDEVNLPSNLDVGQVLVRLKYSGICGSQLGEIDGAKGEDKFLPHLLGHEGSGIVEDIGAGVKNISWRLCCSSLEKGSGFNQIRPNIVGKAKN